MNLPQNDYQILKLTEHFYNAYPNPPYREVLKKNQRAYNCLLFQTHYDFFICIPYRTEIHHPTDAIVDKDEYNETMINLERIKKDALDYVEEYMECMNGKESYIKKCLIENMDFQHYNIFIKS